MLQIPYGADENHFGHLRLPPGSGPQPLVIVIHGGFWRSRFDLSHMEPMCAHLLASGIATWSIEYRRLGQLSGGWPCTCEDVLAGVRHARSLATAYPLDIARIIAVGYSAGGHLALYAAAHERSLAGAVSLAGVADLQLAWDMRLSGGVVRDFLNGLPEQFPQASPANLPIAARQRLVHGDRDESVPVEIARSYARLKQDRGEDIELLELPGVNHSDLVDPNSAAWPFVEKTIRDLIQPPEPAPE